MKLKIDAAEPCEIITPPGPTLLELLRGHGVAVNAACGGKGKCQKCRVQVTDGFVGITSVDRGAFHESELAQGWRLSCQCLPKTNASIKVPGLAAASQKATWTLKLTQESIESFRARPDRFKFILDLGSTGLALALYSLDQRKIICEIHALNPQISFGADVMTRLEASMRLGVEPLKQSLLQGIERCLNLLKTSVELPPVFEIWLAGNSAMTSFIHTWNIDSLAVSPFQPVQLGKDAFTRFEWGDHSIDLKSLPLIAGFVGGDTTAGILAVEDYLKKHSLESQPWMLIDVGTNTEIVLRDQKNQIYWTTSAPAGPAFEGGNISCGMRAEPGAISKAVYSNSAWQLQTIGGDKARGICGSGLIEILDQAVQGGMIARDGMVAAGSVPLTHDLSLSRDDVREFQLAKSATRTAADLLCNRSEQKPEILFLAGNFAGHIHLESAKRLGLLPEIQRTIVLGNGALIGLGALMNMNPSQQVQFFDRLEEQKQPIELALQDDFQENFVRNLNF